MSPMTPVRIRGKKHKDSRHSLDSLSNPRTKITCKRPSLTVSTPPKSSRRPRQVLCITKSKPVDIKFTSPLENLPTELLEFIFFHCLNISLPRASPIIGQKLASNHVKSHLTLNILSSPSCSCTYCPSTLAAVYPTLPEQAEAQSAILRMKWMNLPFLKDIIPTYIVKTLVKELGSRKIRWMGDGPVVSSECEPLIRQYLKDNEWRLGVEQPSGLPAYWEVVWDHPIPGSCANADGHGAIRLGIGLQDGLVTLRSPIECERIHIAQNCLWMPRCRWRILCGVEGCRIPEKLLHGPWTEEKCEFLEIAIRGNASVDWVGTTDGEIAKEGFQQALEEGNPRAVRALGVRLMPFAPSDSLSTTYYPSEEARDLGKYEDSLYTDTPLRKGVGVHVTAKDLRKAAAVDDDRMALLNVLLSGRDPRDDDCLDKTRYIWVSDKTGDGDDDGDYPSGFIRPRKPEDG